MLVDVIAVRTCPDFQLDLEFKNGERRRFDMRPLLAMKPWDRIAAPAVFERVRVDYGTVVWPGEIDVAPKRFTTIRCRKDRKSNLVKPGR